MKPIELSLHRVHDGEVQPLDERRLLDRHLLATVEDEEIVSIETPDGGRASIFGAGPASGFARVTAVDVSVDVLTEQLAQLVHGHAGQGGMVIARWRPLADRSIPEAVFVTAASQVRHLPPSWPDPVVCTTGEQLFGLLKP